MQVEVMTPGTNEKHDLAGALDLATGTLHHCLGPRKTHALFRELLQTLEDAYPAAQYRRLSVVVDNDKIHKAKAVEEWFAKHPRGTLLFLPTYGPRANPIERAFGDVHDLCTRNHTRKRLLDLVAAVVEHLRVNGPWQYKLSALYSDPAVTEAVDGVPRGVTDRSNRDLKRSYMSLVVTPPPGRARTVARALSSHSQDRAAWRGALVR